MARMLTEEEVREIEEQRALRDRARAAGSTAGMDWNERRRFEEAQERQMWDQRFRETHGGLSRAEVAAAGPNGSGRQNAAIKRGFELQAQREFEQKKLGEELGTKRFEAEQKRLGMREQGMEAAKANRDAAIRTAEVQAANAEKIAGINKEIEGIKAKRDTDVETIRGKNNLEVAKEQGDTNVDVARIGKEGAVEAERVRAEALERRLMTERLMQERKLDENSAVAITKAALEMVRNSKNKQTGKPTMTYEEALEKVIKMRKSSGKSVGTPRPTSNWEY